MVEGSEVTIRTFKRNTSKEYEDDRLRGTVSIVSRIAYNRPSSPPRTAEAVSQTDFSWRHRSSISGRGRNKVARTELCTEKITRIPHRRLVLLGKFIADQKIQTRRSCPGIKV
jgi:hypothetical protein